MKVNQIIQNWSNHIVAPLVGAWIERMELEGKPLIIKVAPLVGAWIESRKYHRKPHREEVAPLVGAWIERDR